MRLQSCGGTRFFVGACGLFAVALVLASGTAGAVCRVNGLGPGDFTFVISFDGLSRNFDVHIPASYTGVTPVPLILDFHGFGSTKGGQRSISGIEAQSDEEGFIAVWPQGFSNSWNGGDFCCGAAQDQNLDDVGLAIAIVNEVSAVANIDHSRVYATGLSNGGAMSHRLFCEAADVFAAAAPVSFPIDFSPLSDCQPSRPMAVLHFHGLQDTTVPFNGSFFSVPVETSFNYRGEVTACVGGPVTLFASGTSSCDSFTNCPGGVRQSLCALAGGHVLYSNNVLNIADVALNFFSDFTLPLPDSDQDGVPNQDDNCPNDFNPNQEDGDGDCTGDVCEGNGITVLGPDTFEGGFGNWTNVGGDDIDWTRDSGGTPSANTGPGVDHTTGTGSGFYLYTESSTFNTDPDGNPDKVALLESPCIDLSGFSSAELTFFRHMLGAAMGSLNVDAAAGCSGTFTTLFTTSGDQGNAFTATSVDLTSFVGGSVQLRIRGVTGTSFTSDMAIDDVEVTATP